MLKTRVNRLLWGATLLGTLFVMNTRTLSAMMSGKTDEAVQAGAAAEGAPRPAKAVFPEDERLAQVRKIIEALAVENQADWNAVVYNRTLDPMNKRTEYPVTRGVPWENLLYAYHGCLARADLLPETAKDVWRREAIRGYWDNDRHIYESALPKGKEEAKAKLRDVLEELYTRVMPEVLP